MKNLNLRDTKARITVGEALAILIIIGLGIFFLMQAGYLKGNINITTNVTTQNGSNVTQNGLISITDPLKFSVNDLLAGGSAGNSVVSMYNTQGQKVDSCTLSSGTCTTTASWSSGQSFIAYVTLTNFVSEYVPFTVPFVPAGNTYTTIPVLLNQVKLGTLSIQLSDSAGNQYTSNTTKPKSGLVSTTTAVNQAKDGVYNFTTSSTSTVTFTLTFRDTVTNTGFASTYDPLNNLWQNLIAELSNSNGTASTSGLPQRFTTGTAYYWPITVNDGIGDGSVLTSTSFALSSSPPSTPSGISSSPTSISMGTGEWSAQTIGSNSQVGGAWTYSFVINKGTLTAGQALQFTIKGFDYASAAYYGANSNYGPNAAQLGSTFTFWVAV